MYVSQNNWTGYLFVTDSILLQGNQQFGSNVLSSEILTYDNQMNCILLLNMHPTIVRASNPGLTKATYWFHVMLLTATVTIHSQPSWVGRHGHLLKKTCFLKSSLWNMESHWSSLIYLQWYHHPKIFTPTSAAKNQINATGRSYTNMQHPPMMLMKHSLHRNLYSLLPLKMCLSWTCCVFSAWPLCYVGSWLVHCHSYHHWKSHRYTLGYNHHHCHYQCQVTALKTKEKKTLKHSDYSNY